MPVVRSKITTQRQFLDISSIKATLYGAKKFWLMVIDDSTDYIWSFFLKKKNDLCAATIGLIKDLKAKNCLTVKYVRCDNAGENTKLEDELMT